MTNEEKMKQTLEWIAGQGQINYDAYHDPHNTKKVPWYLSGIPTEFRHLREAAKTCLKEINDN